MEKSLSKFQWRDGTFVRESFSFPLFLLLGNMDKLSSSIRLLLLRAVEFRESWNWFLARDDHPEIAKLRRFQSVQLSAQLYQNLRTFPTKPFPHHFTLLLCRSISKPDIDLFLTRRFAVHTSKDQEFLKRIDFTYGIWVSEELLRRLLRKALCSPVPSSIERRYFVEKL